MKKGPKAERPVSPDTLNAELWAKVQRIIKKDRISIADARRVQAVGLLPFDRGWNVWRSLCEPYYLGEKIPQQPSCLAEHFLFIFRKNPEVCLEILEAVTNHMRGRTQVAAAVARDFCRVELESSGVIVRSLEKKGINVSTLAIDQQRSKIRKASMKLQAAEQAEINPDKKRPTPSG